MNKLNLNIGMILSRGQQKSIYGGGPYDEPCNQYWHTCCTSNDECMDPTTEAPDDGSYSVCEGNYCVSYN